MPKFNVTVSQSLFRYTTITVQAEDKEDAKEAAFDEIWAKRNIVWTEKVQETDTMVSDVLIGAFPEDADDCNPP